MVLKSPTTWLPRFWRKPEAALSDSGLADAGLAESGLAEQTGLARVDDSLDGVILGKDARAPIPLDDRLPDRQPDRADAPAEPPAVIAEPVAPLPPAVVHPLACVDPAAVLAEGVEVGPFCVVGPHVRLGRGTRLMNNVTVVGNTTVGAHNLFFPNSVVGTQPQDKKFNGEDTRVEIGDHNHLREGVTIHCGTAKGGGLTKIGSGNLLMVNCHLGHDVIIGDGCIFANNVMIAGHVHVGNHVVLSGAAGVHHFVTIGDYVYAGGQAKMSHDVPPFVKVDDANKIRGVNSVGLRRSGQFSDLDISAVEQAVWELFLDRDRGPVNATIRKFRGGAMPEVGNNAQVKRVLEFLERRNLGKHGRYLESQRAG